MCGYGADSDTGGISSGKRFAAAYSHDYTSKETIEYEVTIPATVKIDGVTYKVTKIADNAFKNNKTVTKVTVGSNIKTIGKNAFYKCKKLKTIKIGKNVTTIGSNAFKGCKKLFKQKGLSSKVKVKGY